MGIELHAGELVTMAALDGSEVFAGLVTLENALFALVRVVEGETRAEYAIDKSDGACVAIFPPDTALPVLVPLAARAAHADADDARIARSYGHIEPAPSANGEMT